MRNIRVRGLVIVGVMLLAIGAMDGLAVVAAAAPQRPSASGSEASAGVGRAIDPDDRTAPVRASRLLSYRYGTTDGFVIAISSTGHARLNDHGKSKTFSFVLSSRQLRSVKAKLAAARVKQLPRHIVQPFSHIVCGTDPQQLTAAGRTIKVDYAATVPARLQALFDALLSVVDRKDPPSGHGVARDQSAAAARGTGPIAKAAWGTCSTKGQAM